MNFERFQSTLTRNALHLIRYIYM